MTSFAKTTGLAGILVAVLATVTPELRAAQLDRAVREGQAVTTELGANASAITYWVSEPDGGQTAALNKGFKKATGDVVAYLNSDDIYLPAALALISREC